MRYRACGHTRSRFLYCTVIPRDHRHAASVWRFRHMKTVERTTGYEGGTGRSSGFAFLRRVLEHTFFAELIDVRTVIGAP